MQRDRSLGVQVTLRQQGLRCGGPFPFSTYEATLKVAEAPKAQLRDPQTASAMTTHHLSILAPQTERTMSEFITPSSMLPSTRKAGPPLPPAFDLLHWLRRHVISIVVLLALLSAVVSVAA